MAAQRFLCCCFFFILVVVVYSLTRTQTHALIVLKHNCDVFFLRSAARHLFYFLFFFLLFFDTNEVKNCCCAFDLFSRRCRQWQRQRLRQRHFKNCICILFVAFPIAAQQIQIGIQQGSCWVWRWTVPVLWPLLYCISLLIYLSTYYVCM